MRKPLATNSFGFAWALPLVVFMMTTACNERQPGCLDIQAENFSFDAERSDLSLCNYPNLLLNVLYEWGDSSLRTGFIYENIHGMAFVVHNVQILFSGFVVESVTGDELSVVDQVFIRTGSCDSGTEVEIPDDFVFADRSLVNYIIGGFRESGPMESCRVTLGIPEAYVPMCRDDLPPGHILLRERAGFRESTGDFALGRFVVSQDSVNAARDTFLIYAPPTERFFPLGRAFKRGTRDTLYMAIDFNQILNPVDWTMSVESVGQQISDAIPEAVRIR